MDYTKKNGVLVPKERLFAPMLSTFGGGSIRGFKGAGGGAGVFVEFALVGGGGGGGDGNAPGGGGGAGGMIEGSGTFPLNTTFTLQLGAGGRSPQSADASGLNGYETRLYDQSGSGSGLDIKAYGGGRGASYASPAGGGGSGVTLGSAGGGSGPSNYNYGSTAGDIAVVVNSSLVPDISTSNYGNDGGNYSGYVGGGGGGAAGNGSTPTGGSARSPQRHTSGGNIWSSSLNWAKGGNGSPGSGSGTGAIYGFGHLGNGGQGSGDNINQDEQNGSIGGAIINVPTGTTVTITGSNGNMSTSNTGSSLSGSISYVFYDANYKFTDGSLSGSFNITFS